MNVKGWAVSNEKPNEKISKDGISVSFAGMAWRCEIDAYSLNHQPLYFAKKVRGRLPKNVEFFDPRKHKMEQFVPEVLTRRNVTSLVCQEHQNFQKFGSDLCHENLCTPRESIQDSSYEVKNLKCSPELQKS